MVSPNLHHFFIKRVGGGGGGVLVVFWVFFFFFSKCWPLTMFFIDVYVASASNWPAFSRAG